MTSNTSLGLSVQRFIQIMLNHEILFQVLFQRLYLNHSLDGKVQLVFVNCMSTGAELETAGACSQEPN